MNLIGKFARLSLLVGILLFAFNASADNIISPGDQKIYDSSHVVVVGKVLKIRSVRPKTNAAPIETDITLKVLDNFKGSKVGKRVTFRLRGGKVKDVFQLFSGSPRFEKGAEGIYYLRLDSRDTLRLTLWSLSKADKPGSLGGARSAGTLGDTTRYMQLLSTAESNRPPQGARTSSAGIVTPHPPRLVGTGQLLNSLEPYDSSEGRWYKKDIPVYMSGAADPILKFDGSRAAIQVGSQAWSNSSGGALNLFYSGETSHSNYSSFCNGLPGGITISYGISDDDITSSPGHPCGGVLGQTSVCGKLPPPGASNTLPEIIGAGVGIGGDYIACPFWTPANVTELVTHEIGHAIGFGHTSIFAPTGTPSYESIMYPVLHADQRGARIGSYDLGAIGYFYPPAGGVRDFRVVPARTELGVGQELTLIARLDPDGPGGPAVPMDVTSASTFISSNPSVAEITKHGDFNSPGVVKGKAIGTASISADFWGSRSSATAITVSNQFNYPSCTISGPTIVEVGEPVTLTYSCSGRGTLEISRSGWSGDVEPKLLFGAKADLPSEGELASSPLHVARPGCGEITLTAIAYPPEGGSYSNTTRHSLCGVIHTSTPTCSIAGPQNVEVGQLFTDALGGYGLNNGPKVTFAHNSKATHMASNGWGGPISPAHYLGGFGFTAASSISWGGLLHAVDTQTVGVTMRVKNGTGPERFCSYYVKPTNPQQNGWCKLTGPTSVPLNQNFQICASASNFVASLHSLGWVGPVEPMEYLGRFPILPPARIPFPLCWAGTLHAAAPGEIAVVVQASRGYAGSERYCVHYLNY